MNTAGTEFWLHAFPTPGRTAADAVAAEEAGFAGMLVADSTMLVADPYLELLLAARETRRLRLGPGVTNPVTRHPAVTAAAIATLQIESGGRAELVLGRGDSAVLQLGLRPAKTAVLEAALTTLDTCLHGPATPMRWITPFAMPPVPIAVAATGPATIALGARSTGRIDLTVGADPERVAHAVAVARSAAPAGSRLSIGAFVNVGVHPDPATARIWCGAARRSSLTSSRRAGRCGARTGAGRGRADGDGVRGSASRPAHRRARDRASRRLPRPVHRGREPPSTVSDACGSCPSSVSTGSSWCRVPGTPTRASRRPPCRASPRRYCQPFVAARLPSPAEHR